MRGTEKDTKVTRPGSGASESGKAPYVGGTRCIQCGGAERRQSQNKKHQLEPFCTLSQSSNLECTSE